jgi:hypothetical protein
LDVYCKSDCAAALTLVMAREGAAEPNDDCVEDDETDEVIAG